MEIIGAIRHYWLPSGAAALILCAVWLAASNMLDKKAGCREWVSRFFLLMVVAAIAILTDGYKVFTEGIATYVMEPNLIPLVQTVTDLGENFEGMMEQIKDNIVLFIPFGFFLPPAFAKYDWNRRKLLLITVGFVLVVETLELLAGRYFDIDDVFINSLGALIGYEAYRMAHWSAQAIGGKDNLFAGNV